MKHLCQYLLENDGKTVVIVTLESNQGIRIIKEIKNKLMNHITNVVFSSYSTSLQIRDNRVLAIPFHLLEQKARGYSIHILLFVAGLGSLKRELALKDVRQNLVPSYQIGTYREDFNALRELRYE